MLRRKPRMVLRTINPHTERRRKMVTFQNSDVRNRKLGESFRPKAADTSPQINTTSSGHSLPTGFAHRRAAPRVEAEIDGGPLGVIQGPK